jgi:hypothetical protein
MIYELFLFIHPFIHSLYDINNHCSLCCLGFNDIGSEGAIAIADMLRVNAALTSIDLCE